MPRSSGIGMNATELAANPRLSRWFVQNLNRDTRLPLADNSVDAAMVCVSVQYLQRPVAVLRDVARVLRPARRSSSAFRTGASGQRRWRSGGRWTMRATPSSSSTICVMPGSSRSRRTGWPSGSRMSATRLSRWSAARRRYGLGPGSKHPFVNPILIVPAKAGIHGGNGSRPSPGKSKELNNAIGAIHFFFLPAYLVQLVFADANRSERAAMTVAAGAQGRPSLGFAGSAARPRAPNGRRRCASERGRLGA